MSESLDLRGAFFFFLFFNELTQSHVFNDITNFQIYFHSPFQTVQSLFDIPIHTTTRHLKLPVSKIELLLSRLLAYPLLPPARPTCTHLPISSWLSCPLGAQSPAAPTTTRLEVPSEAELMTSLLPTFILLPSSPLADSMWKPAGRRV